MKNHKLGVGIVGLDHWYNAIPFINQLSISEDFEIISVSDGDIKRAKQLIKSSNITITTDDAFVLNHPDIQLIANFTSTDRNAAVCIAAAKHGKHLLANKPLGMTTKEAFNVVQEVEKANIILIPFESYARLTPLHRQLKQWIDDGWIGDIQCISYAHEASLPVAWVNSEQAGWWTDAKRTPGGGWIDHAIYQIDFIRWLSHGSVISSYGQIGNIKFKHLEVEDYGIANLSLDNGIIAISKAHWLSPTKAFRRVIEVIGTEGVILVDSSDDRIRIASQCDSIMKGGDTPVAIDSGGTWTSIPMPKQQGSVLLEHLKSVLQGESSPIATALDAKENLDSCLRFYESAISIP